MSHNPKLTKDFLTTTPQKTTHYTYSCQNKLSNISTGEESMSLSYDGAWLTQLSQQGVLHQNIDYSYNSDFLLASMSYAGETQSYLYNDDGELTSVAAMAIAPYMITRERKGKKVTLTDGTYSKVNIFNRYGELRKTKDNLLTVRLVRNTLGQITKKVEKLKNKKTVYRYTYDKRGRLTKVKKRNKTIETYTYDNNGNRQSAKVHGTSTTASYTLDDNLVTYGQNTYLYDDDGYLQTKTTPQGTTTYTYGTKGELKEVTTPTKTISYQQNALNQRVAKLVDGEVVEKYLWANLTTLLAVYDKDDTLVQRFEYAGTRMPVAMRDVSGTKYYLHYDQVGSLRAVSDAQHNIVKEITYDTYGNILTETNLAMRVPFGFAGGLYDSDTKLTRFGYRDYDAYTGKWTAKDPIGFGGGDSNLYGYVLGDPVDFVDSSGLAPFLSTIQCNKLQEILEFEREYGTIFAAQRYSNTWGDPRYKIRASGDNRLGGNTYINSSVGPIDFDWYLDLASFGYGLLPVAAYPVGKTLWNVMRDMPLSNMYSPEEVNAIWALMSFHSMNDLFGDECKKGCK